MTTKTHGGARKGAGRPRSGNPRTIINFTFSQETIDLLRRNVQPRERSVFVELAVKAALRSR